MSTICPYCNIEVSESAIEAEDGCCPECGALIIASSLRMDGDEEDDFDVYDEGGSELDFDEDDDYGDERSESGVYDDLDDGFDDGFDEDFEEDSGYFEDSPRRKRK